MSLTLACVVSSVAFVALVTWSATRADIDFAARPALLESGTAPASV